MSDRSAFRVEPATEDEIVDLVSIIVPAFSDMPIEAITTGPPTPENIKSSAGQHRHALRLHAQQSDVPAAVKCVYTDSKTGQETIVGAAEWFIHTRERTQQEYMTPNYLMSNDWVTDDAGRKKAQDFCKPFIDARVRWMGGKPYGLLMYMSVKPEWRRKGVSTMVVQWGMDQCEKLGVPAFLEASKMGAPVYAKLGFETVEDVEYEWDGEKDTFPIMIKWPKGTRDEDKKAVFT